MLILMNITLMDQKNPNICVSAFNRRDFLQIGVKTLLATAFGGLGGCGAGKPLKIAAQIWPGYSFLYLAREQGLISGDSMELIKTANLGASASALVKGQVDGAALTLVEVVSILDQGLPLRVVLVLDSSSGADAVLVKPGIKKLADMKGKYIGVESSALGAVMLAKLLEASGLTRDDINIIAMDFDHLKVWGSGKLDAIITYDPIANLLEQKGLVRIWDSRKIPGTIIDVLAVRSEAIDGYSLALTEIVAGHFKALAMWQKNPIDTAYLLGKTLQINVDEVTSTFKDLDLPDASFNRHYLSPPASELKKTITDLIQIMIHDKLIRQPPDFDNLFTADFLPGDL